MSTDPRGRFYVCPLVLGRELDEDDERCQHYRAPEEPLREYETHILTFSGSIETGFVHHKTPCAYEPELEGHATCTYEDGGEHAWLGCDAVFLCRYCTDWDPEHLAYPGEKPGSMRICKHGETTHAGSWKPCWRERTPEQVLAAANDNGRLF